MTAARLVIAACAAATLLFGAAAAQDAEIKIIENDTENEVETPDTGETENVDVVSPEEVVDAEAGEAGEAVTVSADDLVRLDGDFVLPSLNVPVYALDDYDLEDRNGEDIGEVEFVVGPDENTATAVVIEFDGPGWFFADGDVRRVVDISMLSIEGDTLIVDVGEDEVRALPVYQD